MGSQPVEFDEFAACLRALKARTGLSYGALARRTRIGSSTLHRYCSGSYVPQDYGSAHRFATACGASPEELRRLHRLWALADAAREPGRGTSADPGRDQAVAPAVDRAADETVDHNGTHAPDPGPSRDPDLDRGPDPDPNADPDPNVVAASGTPRRPAWLRRRPPALVAVALVLALGAVAWGIAAVSGTGATAGDEEGVLFSAQCPEPVSMGQQDVCVREVQRLLARAGAELDVDGEFGPETLRRVTAFQVLSRIGVSGVVGEETEKALYAPKIRMATWSPEKVRQRIREVFREAPDRAAAIARCQSSLDPLYIVPNPDGTRNWGVFQLADATLRTLGGTPREAMDPEWNIQAAHRLWGRAKNFGDWARCDAKTSPGAAGPVLVPAPDGLPTAPAPAPEASSSQTPAHGNCPAPGQRFKTATDLRMYLVGPGRRLYYIPDETVYFNLWEDWDGVATLSAGVFADCAWDEAHELADAFLARTEGSSRAYIWDAWYGYRLIPNRTAFDKYGFSEARIQTRPSLSPLGGGADWQ